MATRNGVLYDYEGNQIAPATTAEQVKYDAATNMKQAIDRKSGHATVANAAADMTDQTAIYVYTGDETGYTFGHWYYYDGSDWVDGGVYTNIETDSSLSVAGKAADSKAVGDSIEETNNKLSNIIDTATVMETVDTSEAVRLEGYKINSRNTLSESSNSSVLYFTVEESGTYNLLPSSTSQFAALIYNNISEESEYHGITSANYVKAMEFVDADTRESQGTVEAGQTIVCHALSKTFTFVLSKFTGETVSLKETLPLTETMEESVDNSITSALDDIFNDGMVSVSAEDCAKRAWTGYNSIDNRNNRVRITKDIRFSKDTYILMKKGFYVAGYKSDGSSFGDVFATFLLPANTTVHLYIRRVNEDASEDADIAEFASAISFSTLLTPIELYNPTFTDVSMFTRIGICGDSYASGGGIISGVRPLTWGKNLERQAGITVDIYAKSGQNVVQWVTDATNGLPALLNGEECGFYWLQHGINGTSTDESIGTAEDMSANPRPQTFYGQYTEAIMQIKEHFPFARIALATIIGSSWTLAESLQQYKKVNKAISDIAEYCEVMLIDVTEDDFYRTPFYSQYTRSNHPTAMQNAGIAMANRRLISKCIQNNPDYFVSFGSNW